MYQTILKSRRAELQPHTYKDYTRWLSLVKRTTKRPCIENTDQLYSFIEKVREKYDPSTLKHILSILHMAHVIGHFEGMDMLSPRKIKIPRAYSRPRETIEAGEHEAILSLLKKSKIRDVQKKAILSLLYDTGARIGEILSLNLSDFREKNTAMVKTEKTGQWRAIFWSDETQKLLNAYLPFIWDYGSSAAFVGIRSEGKLTNRLTSRTVERWLMALCKKAGIQKRIVPHSYRHAAIKRWFASNMPITQVRLLSGHSSITSLEHYQRYGIETVREWAMRSFQK